MRMIALGSSATALLLFFSILSAPAWASGPACSSLQERNCNAVKPPPSEHPGGGGGGDRNRPPGTKRPGGGDGGSEPTCDGPKQGVLCVNYPPDVKVPGGPARPEPPSRIPESDFQTFDLPVPEIYAWPKDWAITGRPAAFWTNADTGYINMTLLTYAVTVKVTPEEYSWNFGDGTGSSTTTTGSKPLPGDKPQIGHTFKKSGTKTVTMTTTYSGQFSVDGGPWIDIDGRAYVTSAGIPIEVFRYHRYLVDEDCNANPYGPDCQ